jgi:hypothetical protein
MASRIASLITFLRAVVDAFRTQQAQIAELQANVAVLQNDNAALTARVTALEGHAETVTGVTGITADLDQSAIADLQDQLAAAMPAPAEPAAEPAAPQSSLEPQQAAA